MSQVRVRFAPSPTGFFHIGSARTALFNWLYARHTGGVFILRIEDTDRERNQDDYLQLIYDSLSWLGLNWDEGPGAGGDFGPYRQSERTHIYREYFEKLKAAGRTYEQDGAVYFKLLGERYEAYDDHRKKTVTKVRNAPAVIDDRIRGRVERTEDEDLVIIRSDGNPVFHFVNVVDDITMGITHVIRGEDHLSNTSKHIELFKAFGVPVPEYAHIPLILKSPEMGKGKMSKRDQGALIGDYQQRRFRPEAVVNYLALLGWNPGDDREKMPVEDIIRLFDFPGINQSNAKFDPKKLAHMNMQYVHEMSEAEFEMENVASMSTSVTTSNWVQESHFPEVLRLAHPKIKSIDEVPEYTRYFFTEDYPIDDKVRTKVLAKGDPKARLDELIAALEPADFSSDTAIEEAIKALAEGKGLGFGDYQAVARLAVTGTNAGPSITSIFRVLGRERTLGRLRRFAGTI